MDKETNNACERKQQNGVLRALAELKDALDATHRTFQLWKRRSSCEPTRPSDVVTRTGDQAHRPAKRVGETKERENDKADHCAVQQECQNEEKHV